MYKVAIFGAGRMGHVRAKSIAMHKKTAIAGIVESHQQYAENFADSYGVNILTAEQVMSDESIRAVCICSVTDTHADLVEMAARHGKAIFCEQPIDLNPERITRCLEVVREHDVPFLVGYYRRYDPQFRTLCEQFESGQIGVAESLTIISREPSLPTLEYIRNSGGLFKSMSLRDLDMARYILDDEPVSVSAHGSALISQNIADEGDVDTAVIVLTFRSGAIATIINSRRSGYGYDQRIELHGSKGLLRADNTPDTQVEHWGDEGCVRATPQFEFYDRYQRAFQLEWQHFVDVLGGMSIPQCMGDDGLRALQLADAAKKSLETGQTILL
ncbi:inositol 2-dehydrogenase [Veronia nyctiphanis]|uniref:Inositol 2-dehydrogenase n=1 Tax=Veronia nyctiphanis TaxID=1278244 RepID=A0A4Q0YP43_9GAMM|nr:inositol 2-dehydrogenase [Veronia nyctiphanis]RXJ72702.1 inositol 2-dehydrogenase [Veronia nyctiphanis]